MPTSSSESHPGHCIEGFTAAVYSCPGVEAGNVTQVTSRLAVRSAPSRQYINGNRSLNSCASIVRPSIGNAFSSMLKPTPSLCGKAAPMLVQRFPAFPLLSYSSTVKTLRAWIAARFTDRRESVHGSNACVRRVTKNGHPGLARSTDSTAQCCGKNFRRFRIPASRGKPVVCRQWQTPLGACAEAVFFTLRKASSDPLTVKRSRGNLEYRQWCLRSRGNKKRGLGGPQNCGVAIIWIDLRRHSRYRAAGLRAGRRSGTFSTQC